MSNKFISSMITKIGINTKHRIIAEGGIPPLQYNFEREKWALAERFGQYGLKSGVDIRQLWPTVEEIDEIKALRMFRLAKEAQKISEQNFKSEEARQKNRLDKIEENWRKHDQLLNEYYEEQAKSGEKEKTDEQELQRKIREIQEYFGYWVDPKDPRFELLFQQKEENAKLEEKLQKQKKKSKRKIVTSSETE